jgi:hypothetical protein
MLIVVIAENISPVSVISTYISFTTVLIFKLYYIIWLNQENPNKNF